MRFYFPDSQDLVSPTYDFIHDEYSPLRVRQRDDLYAHEVLGGTPYDGMLVSKAIVDGSVKGAGKYSEPQRQRMYRLGVEKFFRLPKGMESLGDCGAFNYASETEPPYTIAEVVDFYEGCGFQAGVSMDHVILGYDDESAVDDVDSEWVRRHGLTLCLAEDFLAEVVRRGRPFEPVGAAQGWSPASYTESVERLQEMGYRRIALGGMVPLKTHQILASLHAIDSVRALGVELHLLGVTRVESMPEFASLGVTSFDSTTPLRQAFMDDRSNYHTADSRFTAIRVPQVDGNPSLRRAILAGTVRQKDAVTLERQALKALRAFDVGELSVSAALEAVLEYENLVLGGKKSYAAAYAESLTCAPWKACGCHLCQDLGIEIMIFRGTERNKRRGFHNLQVLAAKVRQLDPPVKKVSRKSHA